MNEAIFDPIIDASLARLKGHGGNARSWLKYVLDAQAQIVAGRRIWQQACERVRDTVDLVNGKAIDRLADRLGLEPFGYVIFFKLISTEHNLATTADAADLLERYENMFPK
jgi:hypothetical protein